MASLSTAMQAATIGGSRPEAASRQRQLSGTDKWSRVRHEESELSYYTWANLQYVDGGPISLSELNDGLQSVLKEQGLHSDVGKGLADLLTKKEAYFTFYGGSVVLETLLLWVSSQRPAVSFGVQGRGEDLRDVWVREFSGGGVVFAEGPFTE